MGAPDFWDNPDAAQKTAQAVTQLKEEVGIVHNLEQRLDDLEVMVELALEEPESGMEEELEAGLEAAKAEIEHLELGMLLNGEYDANNAILTLHARRYRSTGLDKHASAHVYPLCRTPGLCH